MKNPFKQLIANFKYKYSFLKVLNSPFVGLKLKWYFGEIEHGTPYFLPRRWVKCDRIDAVKAWYELKDIKKIELVKENANAIEIFISNYIKSYTKPVQIKYFGWQFTTLGWKTKWDDYRFEWSPILSIVLFGKQICIWIMPKFELDDYMIALDCYWEAWLTYKNMTDKTKSKIERLQHLKEIYSCSWGSEDEGYTDYYQFILKKKYL